MKPKNGSKLRMVKKKLENSSRIKKGLTEKKQLPPKDDDDSSIDSYGNIRNLIDYEMSESDTDTSPRKLRSAAINARKRIRKALEDSNDIEEDDDDEDYNEEDEDEDEMEDEEIDEEIDEMEDEELEEDEDTPMDPKKKSLHAIPEIRLNFSSFSNPINDVIIPKRHNMKKESEHVKKFVKLMTEPIETTTIDDQIDQFKSLDETKQAQMISSLERKPATEESLMFKILTMNLPPDIQSMVLSKYNNLQSMDTGTSEYYKLRTWIEKLISVPLGIYKELPAKLQDGHEACSTFMQKAQKCLADAIYGQEEAKMQILQFIATKMANPNSRGLSLMLSGPPGIGKTSLIKGGIAKALEWPFQFISLGGDSDATTYTGHQPVYEGSHCGKIVNSFVISKSMSMVLMFDELDKISATPKGEEIQNLLVHMTDPVQNSYFEDKYLTGIPIDLSKVMFVFSGNDLSKIDSILLDRMVVVQLKGYDLKEKLEIATKFLVHNALEEVNLAEKVAFGKDILTYILENYTKQEPGVREFKRCIEQIAQKINMLRILNSKDMPFYIPNFSLPFVLKKEHVDLFLKKKDMSDKSYMSMYT